MRRSIRCLSFCIFLSTVGLVGCYEGWDPEPVGGPTQPDPGPLPELPKQIYYILYQPIYLNADGLFDDDCFEKSDVRTYRQNEWASRSAALEAAMRASAEKVVVADLGVSADDCETMVGVRSSAISNAPWGTDEPGTDALGRPIIHVKAAFYDGEPQFSPPAVVKKQDWEAMEELINSGRDARSKHYFVLANADDGYFTEWMSDLSEESLLMGTPIDNVDPTTTGIATRDSIISADTTAFSTWLLQ
jgi:hypothetical protein